MMQIKNSPGSSESTHRVSASHQKIAKEASERRSDSSSDGIPQEDQISSVFPSDLPWLNAPARHLAQSRFQQAMNGRLPYVVARQKVGEQEAVMDGGAAFALSSKTDSPTKFFGSDRICWNGNRAQTQYLILFAGEREMIAVGTVDGLLRMKMTISEISRLLNVNALDVEEPDLREEVLPQIRVAYHALLSVGYVLPKAPRLAELVVQPMSHEEKAQAFTNIMVLSASSPSPIFLEAGLKLGYDGTKRSPLVERTAVEQAKRYSQQESLLLLKRYAIE